MIFCYLISMCLPRCRFRPSSLLRRKMKKKKSLCISIRTRVIRGTTLLRSCRCLLRSSIKLLVCNGTSRRILLKRSDSQLRSYLPQASFRTGLSARDRILFRGFLRTPLHQHSFYQLWVLLYSTFPPLSRTDFFHNIPAYASAAFSAEVIVSVSLQSGPVS